MAHTDQSIGTLISISGTLASIGLALVAILTAKTSMDHIETAADDFFLFSSFGFLFAVVLGYLALKTTEMVKAVTSPPWQRWSSVYHFSALSLELFSCSTHYSNVVVNNSLRQLSSLWYRSMSSVRTSSLSSRCRYQS